jgi:hypothetical protein
MKFDKIYRLIILIIFISGAAFYFHTIRYNLKYIKTELDGGGIITTVFRYDTWTGKGDIKYILSTLKDQGTILISVNDIYDPFPQVQNKIIKWKKMNTKK